jgi:hypothetical protein
MNKAKIESGRQATWENLAALKHDILQLVQSLAKQADTAGLIRVNDWLRSTLSVESRHEALVAEANDVAQRGRHLLEPRSEADPNEHRHDAPDSGSGGDSGELVDGETQGGKARGRKCRYTFIQSESERGRELTQVRGAIYRDAAGLTVGVAYGSEKKSRKNKWFLGLPADKFQEAVLLCESLSGRIDILRLPQNFVRTIGRQLSVSKEFNQAKFTIDRQGGRFGILLNGRSIDITEFLDPNPLKAPISDYS